MIITITIDIINITTIVSFFVNSINIAIAIAITIIISDAVWRLRCAAGFANSLLLQTVLLSQWWAMVRCDDGVMVRCDRRPAAGGCERREAVVVAAVAVVVAVVAVVVAVVAVVFFPSPQAQMDVRMLAGGLRNCGCLRSEEDEDDPSHTSPLPSPHFSCSFLYCVCLAFASLLHCLCLVCISLSYHVCPAFVSLLSRFCLAFCLACVSLLSRFCLACFCPACCLAFVSLMSRCLSRCQLPAHLRVWGEGRGVKMRRR